MAKRIPRPTFDSFEAAQTFLKEQKANYSPEELQESIDEENQLPKTYLFTYIRKPYLTEEQMNYRRHFFNKPGN